MSRKRCKCCRRYVLDNTETYCSTHQYMYTIDSLKEEIQRLNELVVTAYSAGWSRDIDFEIKYVEPIEEKLQGEEE